MTRVRHRCAAASAAGDDGSALALALVFLMLFGLVIGVTLQFATTSQRTAVQVAEEGGSTYAAGAALDGAVNRLRNVTTEGTETTGATSCFTLPAGELGNAADVTVTCSPRAGSGAASANAAANTPANAVLATSTDAAEGVTLSGSAKVPVRGPVSVNRRVQVPAGSVLTSTGTIKAGSCTGGGTTTPTCATPNSVTDPGWPKPTGYPGVVDLGAVTCRTPVMALAPGTYLSLAKLQAVLTCANTVVWFQPGLYYFDFRDAGQHELVMDTGDVVVGGRPKGWDPAGASFSPGSLPDPSGGNPSASACDPDAPGVNFLFGNDSRLHVRGGAKVQLCAQETSAGSQHIAVQGLSTDLTGLTGSSVSIPSAATSATWTNPTGAMTVGDGTTAQTTVPSGGPDRSLRLPMSTLAVPAEATNVTATIRVTHSVTSNASNGRGLVQVTAAAGDGSGSLTLDVRNCQTTACTGASRTDSVTIPIGLSPAQLNDAVLTLTLRSDGATSSVTDVVDGVVMDISFRAPLRATGGTNLGAPYVRGSGTTTPVLRTSGTTTGTVLAVHGTIDTPRAAVDLGLTNVPHTVVDRGLLVRHLETSMTPAATFTGYLVELPSTSALPRLVQLTASSSGAELASAEVRLHDGSGGNGSIADLTRWFIG